MLHKQGDMSWLTAETDLRLVEYIGWILHFCMVLILWSYGPNWQLPLNAQNQFNQKHPGLIEVCFSRCHSVFTTNWMLCSRVSAYMYYSLDGFCSKAYILLANIRTADAQTEQTLFKNLILSMDLGFSVVFIVNMKKKCTFCVALTVRTTLYLHQIDTESRAVACVDMNILKISWFLFYIRVVLFSESNVPESEVFIRQQHSLWGSIVTEGMFEPHSGGETLEFWMSSIFSKSPQSAPKHFSGQVRIACQVFGGAK